MSWHPEEADLGQGRGGHGEALGEGSVTGSGRGFCVCVCVHVCFTHPMHFTHLDVLVSGIIKMCLYLV